MITTLKLSKTAIVGALAGLVFSACAAQAETAWDMSIVWPDGNFHTKNAKLFAEKVKDVTGGEVVITVHAGGALGIKGPEGMVAVRDGLVSIADILLNQQSGEAPIMGIESLPFLAPTSQNLALLHKFVRPAFEKVAAQYNQKILYLVPWPGQAVYSKKAISTVDDLAGMKLRVVDANGYAFFTKLGAAPLQMPWGEVVPSLAAGTIEGVTTSSSSGVDGKFWEFLGHMSRFNWQASSNMVSVNLDAWNALSEDHQKAIEDLGTAIEADFWLTSRREDAVKLQILSDNGMEVSTPNSAFRAALMERARPLWDDFADRVPESAQMIKDYLETLD